MIDTSDADFQLLFTSQLLRSQAVHISAAAARHLLTSTPRIAERYAPQPADKWRPSLESRTLELAAAIGAGDPELFAGQVAWAKAAFTARAVPLDDLRESLLALRSALSEFVPPDDAPLAAAYIDRALQRLDTAPEVPGEVLSLSAPHGRLAATYLLALLEADRPRACSVLAETVRAGMGIREVYRAVLTPVLREVGRMWLLGEITVAEEHVATATTLVAMSQLLALAPRRPATGRTIVTATPEGNLHEVGVRMVADVFELEGWRAAHVGASVPADDLAVAAVHFRADVVALSAAMPTHLPALADTIAAVRAAAPATRIIVGGAALECDTKLWMRLGADGFAASPDDALALVDRPAAP